MASSVENAHTGERRAFADLAGLFAFLRRPSRTRCLSLTNAGNQEPYGTSFPDDPA